MPHNLLILVLTKKRTAILGYIYEKEKLKIEVVISNSTSKKSN